MFFGFRGHTQIQGFPIRETRLTTSKSRGKWPPLIVYLGMTFDTPRLIIRNAASSASLLGTDTRPLGTWTIRWLTFISIQRRGLLERISLGQLCYSISSVWLPVTFNPHCLRDTSSKLHHHIHFLHDRNHAQQCPSPYRRRILFILQKASRQVRPPEARVPALRKGRRHLRLPRAPDPMEHQADLHSPR